jgi:hypothetical protein
MGLGREWEKFKGGPVVASQNRMHVTLNPKGIIYMNNNAYRILGKPAAVALYYNRERDDIAIEPANPRFPENFPVRPKQSAWIIQASPFCVHFRLKPSTTQRFVRPDIDDSGILHLELGNTVTTSGTPRKPRK